MSSRKPPDVGWTRHCESKTMEPLFRSRRYWGSVSRYKCPVLALRIVHAPLGCWGDGPVLIVIGGAQARSEPQPQPAVHASPHRSAPSNRRPTPRRGHGVEALAPGAERLMGIRRGCLVDTSRRRDGRRAGPSGSLALSLVSCPALGWKTYSATPHSVARRTETVKCCEWFRSVVQCCGAGQRSAWRPMPQGPIGALLDGERLAR